MGQARLSRSGPGFYPRSGQVSWVRFFRGFSSPVRPMSGNFRPPRSSNIIWPSLSSIIIHYGCQWPEMLTGPKTSNIAYSTYTDPLYHSPKFAGEVLLHTALKNFSNTCRPLRSNTGTVCYTVYQECGVHGMKEKNCYPDIPDNKKKCNTKIKSLISLPRRGE